MSVQSDIISGSSTQVAALGNVDVPDFGDHIGTARFSGKHYQNPLQNSHAQCIAVDQHVHNEVAALLSLDKFKAPTV